MKAHIAQCESNCFSAHTNKTDVVGVRGRCASCTGLNQLFKQLRVNDVITNRFTGTVHSLCCDWTHSLFNSPHYFCCVNSLCTHCLRIHCMFRNIFLNHALIKRILELWRELQLSGTDWMCYVRENMLHLNFTIHFLWVRHALQRLATKLLLLM